MCGRFFVAVDDPELREHILKAEEESRQQGLFDLPPIKTGEIFPTEHVALIVAKDFGQRRYQRMKWGFSGFDGKRPLINARSETVMDLPTFRDLVRENRCLIPASYYYEWMKRPALKQSIKNIMRDPKSTTLYMAGIYRQEPGERVPSFVILTRQAARGIAGIHDRMPVILGREEQRAWLSKDADIPAILGRAMEDIMGMPEEEPGFQ